MTAVCAPHPHGKEHDGHDHGPLKGGIAHEVGGKGGENKFCHNARATRGKEGNLKGSTSGWLEQVHLGSNTPENNEGPGNVGEGFNVSRTNIGAPGFNGFILAKSGDFIGQFYPGQ